MTGIQRPATAGVPTPKPDRPPAGPAGISPRPGAAAPESEFAGFVVAYDLAGPDRQRWTGTDLGFRDRAEADEALLERRAMWPNTPIALYGLVPVTGSDAAPVPGGGDSPC
ncbi:hypothetical protein ACTD5D_00410 [Nocardia takedensis]|uniref:hypothetical protein n=1 Tax=Nocardia takedensis TaxID=259390 RepID=UPI003F7716BB